MTDDEIDKLGAGNNYPGTVPGMRKFARAIIAAHTAKLLADVEMDWDSLTDNPNQSDIKEWVQQYAAAAAVKARMKALDEAVRVCVGVAEITKASGSWALDAQNCAAVIEKLKGKQA